ncbi:hypothetical protein [Micromonospora globbae]|uniref:Uncharacterized protein n=1 Tax=Micromonospora globbae TaxID=1894969 RepID=A0ABZ1SBV1_9ACTN|nr:hypothetical protein [Micromonospora globbae]
MAEQRRPQLPLGHRVARLLVLGTLVGVLAVGGLSDGLAAAVTTGGRWGGDAIAYLWAPVLDAIDRARPAAEPTPTPTLTPSARPKKPTKKPTKKPAKATPTKSRAG